MTVTLCDVGVLGDGSVHQDKPGQSCECRAASLLRLFF